MTQEEKMQRIKRILIEVLDSEDLMSSDVMKEDLFMLELNELTKEFKNEEVHKFGFDLLDMIYNAHSEYPRGWLNELEKYTYNILKSI